MMDFIVVDSTDFADFAQLVTAKLKDGWHLAGSMTTFVNNVSSAGDAQMVFLQPMLKQNSEYAAEKRKQLETLERANADLRSQMALIRSSMNGAVLYPKNAVPALVAALVREVGDRTMGERSFDVPIIRRAVAAVVYDSFGMEVPK